MNMNEFIDYLSDVFRELGQVKARRMFGGYGIYSDGLMFALVDDDTLYLKADDNLRPLFEQQGLPAFQYPKNGKMISMSYYQAPEAIFDDPEEAALWGRRSCDAARRQKRKK